MIAAEKNAIEPNENISLGILNDGKQAFNLDFTNQLLNHSQQPLKSFKILKDVNESKELEETTNNKVVEYVFEQGDNAIKNISNYLTKNNINLFCMDNGKKKISRNYIDNLNVSLLVTS